MSKEVQRMFQGIASRYDVANDVLSFGIHHLWRRKAVKAAGIRPGHQVLDICAGTGDFAFESAKVIGREGQIFALDFVHEMLSLGEKKKPKRKAGRAVHFLQGDALSLPFADEQFDAITIGFGIRNVDDPLAGLIEMKRVLKPGGTVCVLEFGQPTLPGFAWLYKMYSKFIMPKLGGMISGDESAYTYLPETSKEFVAGEAFVALMRKAGFEKAIALPLFSGIAYIYTGIRPK